MSEGAKNAVETNAGSFEHDVLEASHARPVVVDFWAPWCQPCLMLAPALEKVAAQFVDRVALVKANVDAMPEVAGRFGVMSIPAVLGFVDGKVRNSFVGLVPESALRGFFEGLLPTQAELLIKEGRALEQTDGDAAAAKYREAIAVSGPLDAAPRVGLARVLFAQGKADESAAIIEELEKRGYLEPEAETLKAQLLLGHGAQAVGSLDALRRRVQDDPRDFAARLQLAEALGAAGQHAEALEQALELVERDRNRTGEEARKLMVAIFNLLPGDSPLSADFRRRLSFVL